MIIKTFTDDTSAAALKRVREEMGGDAIVLKTRQVTRPGSKPVFEVTACLERASVGQTSAILSTLGSTEKGTSPAPLKAATKTGLKKDSSLPPQTTKDNLDERIMAIDRKLNQLFNLGIQPDGISRLEVFQAVHRQLKEADLPDDYLETFMSTLVESYDGSTAITTYARRKLAEELRTTIHGEIDFKPGDRILFVGPAGSGKLAASLAAKQKQKVKLLTLDDFKLAALDEICSYAEILGLEVLPSPNADESPEKDNDVVTLIDSPALPKQPERLQALKRKIDEIAPQYRFAVFSCLTRSRDVFQISRMLKELNPTHLILTMQDLASCCGTVVTAVKATGVKIVFVSDTPGGMGELKRPDPTELADMLVNAEVTDE
jgi:flagellar biosynthesis protein FlhF